MVTIGNDTLPGTITTIESATSSGANIGAPATPVLVGQAYLSGSLSSSTGSASANTAYRVTRPKKARDLFGDPDSSQLTTAIQDALVEGAYPVYAIAPAVQSVTGEDLSGVTSRSTTLANAPLIEEASDITFTINSTTKNTTLYYKGDPTNASPSTDEVLVNPQTGKVYADESMGNTGDSVDYNYADFSNTYDEITNASFDSGNTFLREVADFIGLVDENDTQVGNAKTKSENMESNGWFNIALAGAGSPYIDDANTASDETSSYTDSYDTSRLQLINPSRTSDGDTIMGAYAGRRSALGIDASPLFKRLDSVGALLNNLNQSQKENLVNAQVIPVDEVTDGAKIVEDLTTVSDSNTDESSWRRGFARLVTDFTTERINAASEPFIGDFNRVDTQNNIKGNVTSILKDLLSSQAIEGFSLVVEEVDSVTLAVDVGIKTTDVLRNIEVTITAGDVKNAVSTEG